MNFEDLLKHKYENDLFCNEILLLPYYIASLNIEHEYFENVREYKAFEGICFADTLNLEGPQMEMFSLVLRFQLPELLL